jgi:aminoglycoside phosphotransferase family enzyme
MVVTIVDSTVRDMAAEAWVPPIRASVAPDATIEVIETRFSWIILTLQHAYKIKKPVDVGQCKHRTLQARHRSCIDEYWINQALAPRVYLGVLPITRDAAGVLRIKGKGEPVEWAVKMRRLRHDRNLLWMIHQGNVTAGQVAALAKTLACFYHARPPITDDVDNLATRLRRRVLDSAEQLKASLSIDFWADVQRVCRSQQKYLDGARALLSARVCDGRVVDGHGDLRPEHVFLERRPLVIDCLEFSAALRKLDALDDLCLLVMGCERLNRRDIATEIMAQYGHITGDLGVGSLEAFYKSLHAMSQAAAIAASPVEPDFASIARSPQEAVSHLRRASEYLAAAS